MNTSKYNTDGFAYTFSARLQEGPYWIPESLESQPDSKGTGYVISGTLSVPPDGLLWPEPPHIVFANLRADDVESVKAFLRRYGPLHEGRRAYDLNRGRIVQTEFSFNSDDIQRAQLCLQAAWEGDSSVSMGEIEGSVVEDMKADVLVDTSDIVKLRPRELWTAICFLFLYDYTVGRLGVCENPDCPARYFRKKRKTQRFCEQGPCVQYAQRHYSLDWWRREGKKRREERQRLRREKRQRLLEKRSRKRSKR